MTSKLFAGAAMLSLCLGAATPALAQDYRFAGFEGPEGANATLNLRVPLGTGARRALPSLGLTVGFGRVVGGPTVGDRASVRQLHLADFRFGAGGFRRAELATFDLAHLDRDIRLGAQGEPGRNGTLKLVLIGLLGVAVGVGAEMLIDGSSEEEDTPGTGPTSPGLG